MEAIRWRPPIVDEDWHAICQSSDSGIDREESGNYKSDETGIQVNIRQPRTSRKAKTFRRCDDVRRASTGEACPASGATSPPSLSTLKTKPNQTRPDQTRTEQNRTEQNRTEQNRTEQNRTEQNRTEQNRTEQNNNAQVNEHLPIRKVAQFVKQATHSRRETSCSKNER